MELDKAIEQLAADTQAEKAKGRRVVLNPAMAAVADIEAILAKLTPKDQIRVLDWINDTFDVASLTA